MQENNKTSSQIQKIELTPDPSPLAHVKDIKTTQDGKIPLINRFSRTPSRDQKGHHMGKKKHNLKC